MNGMERIGNFREVFFFMLIFGDYVNLLGCVIVVDVFVNKQGISILKVGVWWQFELFIFFFFGLCLGVLLCLCFGYWMIIVDGCLVLQF